VSPQKRRGRETSSTGEETNPLLYSEEKAKPALQWMRRNLLDKG